MAIKYNGVVDIVANISRQRRAPTAETLTRPAEYLSVTLARGQLVAVDLSERRGQVWADVLRSLHETGQPAYIEIDLESGTINELLLAITYKVGRILRVKDGLQVELVVSHAKHTLPTSNPRFDELRATLEAARAAKSYVLVSETTDEHEIVDVRPAPASGAGRT